MFTYVLYVLAGAGLLISFMKDKQKTRMALKKAWKSFENILPQLLAVMIIIGFALAVLSPETIFILLGLLDVWVDRQTMMKYTGKGSGLKVILISFLLGSAAAGPLYAAFPVATVMLKKEAVFSTY